MVRENFETTTFSGEGLACRRGGRLIFAGVDFALASGGALTLRGPNGSGKTTLLRLMAGLARSVGGHLAWAGTPLADPEAHQARLRFVGHLDAVKPALTVAENLAFWANFWHADPSRLAPALDVFGLAALADFPARLLSAGQRHRLALARLIAAPAPLWLLDEPANALDEASLNALARAIATHRSQGGMVVIAAHGGTLASDGATLDMERFVPRTPSHWSDGAGVNA